jgi:hypothetical protein
MKTKELYSFQFLVKINSQNRMTDRHPFSNFLYTLFSCRERQSYKGGGYHGFSNLNNYIMKKNKSNWRQSVSISKLPKMLLLGIMLFASSLTFSQSTGNANAPVLPMARMMHNNAITIRTGLHASYIVPCGHFAFQSTQDAVAYFQTREVDYIHFVVIDTQNVYMNLDLTDPAVSSWTLADWNQALTVRAGSVAPRAISNL